MASGFLVLQRFFLRVDGVLVRINDTRLYHAAQTDYLLREYSSREAKIKDLRVCEGIYTYSTYMHVHTQTQILLVYFIFFSYQPVC